MSAGTLVHRGADAASRIAYTECMPLIDTHAHLFDDRFAADLHRKHLAELAGLTSPAGT